MPWREATPMSERSEFLSFVRRRGLTMSALCHRYGVSRKTGYKWLRRARESGPEGLADRSRRPHHSPARTPPAVEAVICSLRTEQPAWGGRKLHHLLQHEGFAYPPAPSTITGILRRNGLLTPGRRTQRDWQRFEEPYPNGLWQMDFKGHFAMSEGRCHPLTVLDDHSRFNLCLAACPNERAETVQDHLTGVMQRYGLPERLLMDNGSPLGQRRCAPAHVAHRLAHPLGRHGPARASLPSADPGQGGTLPSHTGPGGAGETADLAEPD